MLEFWVYVLECADGSFYTGHTDNLEKRLAEHDQGLMCDWTSKRRPVRLAWARTVPTRDEAKAFEYKLKRWSRAKKLALIEEDWAALNHWAKKPRERPDLVASEGPSFSLGTDGDGGSASYSSECPPNVVPSENEGPVTSATLKATLVPSENEGR